MRFAPATHRWLCVALAGVIAFGVYALSYICSRSVWIAPDVVTFTYPAAYRHYALTTAGAVSIDESRLACFGPDLISDSGVLWSFASFHPVAPGWRLFALAERVEMAVRGFHPFVSTSNPAPTPSAPIDTNDPAALIDALTATME